MPNLKEVRNRITSVKSIQQITKAMKMVSAAKLKRATDAVVAIRPYSAKLSELLTRLTGEIETVKSPFVEVRPVKNVLIIAITSNRGQAGAFNTNIIKATLAAINKDYSSQRGGHVHIMALGRKGYDYLSRRDYKMLGSHNDLFAQLDFSASAALAEEVMLGFEEGRWDRVELIYNQFKNAAVQIVTRETLLPLTATRRITAERSNEEPTKVTTTGYRPFYLFEPGAQEIVRRLIPDSIRISLHRALLDSHAAEHAARMTSMEKATENAGELLRNYRLLYNRARQAAITTEILEIVSGANALSSG